MFQGHSYKITRIYNENGYEEFMAKTKDFMLKSSRFFRCFQGLLTKNQLLIKESAVSHVSRDWQMIRFDFNYT